MFKVDLLEVDPINSYAWGAVPSDIQIEHKFHSGGRLGGPYVAEAEVTGNVNSLLDCFMWLRRPVNIYGHRDLLVWWGFVREVRFETHGMVVTLSLDNMANRVKVIYTYKSGLIYNTGDTAWLDDTLSQGRYGVKEFVHTLGESETAAATAVQATALKALKVPNSQYSSRGSSNVPRVTLLFSGWFETLRWKVFNRFEGRMEYEPLDSVRAQLIGWQYTGTDVSFEVQGTIPDARYLIKATTPVFAELEADSLVVVSGSVANNSTFTVENVQDNGNTISVVEAVTAGVAGPSVTVTAVGYETAQRFQATTTFKVDKVSVNVRKVGTPADNFTLAIRADSAGSPGADLVSASIAPSEISDVSEQEAWVTMPYTLTIAAGTYYWVSARRSGSLSATNHYSVRMYSEAYGLTRGYNGSGWVALPDSMAFKVWGSEENASQMKRIIADCGQFFTRLEFESDTGVRTNQYRDGYKTAYDLFIRLFDQGTSTGRRLIAYVDPNRVLQIRVQPDFSAPTDLLLIDGRVTQIGDQDREAGDLPYCKWIALEGFAIQLSDMLQISPFFVDEARWDSGKPDAFEVIRAVDEFTVL